MASNELFKQDELQLKPSRDQTKIIAEIARKFSENKIRLVELSGQPGSGKTYVAEHIVNQIVRERNGEMVTLPPIQLADYCTVTEMIRHVSGLLSLPESDGQLNVFRRSIQQHICSNTGYLFTFENVETLQRNDQLEMFLDLCRELMTSKLTMLVILTTQLKLDFVRDLSKVDRRTMPLLTLEESTQLVKRVAGRDANLSDSCWLEIFNYTKGIPRRLIETGLKMQQLKDLSESRLPTLFSNHMNEVPLTELMILNDISRTLRDDLVTLSYFPGSFSAEAATAVLGSQKPSFAKHDVLSPLHSHCLVSTTDVTIQRFEIRQFLRRFLEDAFLLYRNSNVHIRNRFCVFFAHVMKQMTEMEIHERQGQRFSLFTMEIDNLQKFLLEAVHCLDENYDLFFDVAYNAEYYITNLLPKRESVDFYESMCNAAVRHSKQHHGIMLSSFRQVLAFAQNRHDEAYQQYMKALESLRPFGESTDLAWLYSHIGYIWYEKGKFKKAERYFSLALRMMRRQDILLRIQESRYSELSRPIGLQQARILLNRTMSSAVSSLGLLYNHIGNFQKSIDNHEEAMEIRKQLFGLHPMIGSGYNNLCLVYDRAGQRGKALEYAKKGLQIKKVFVKQPSNTVLVSLLNVALFTHTYEGDVDKALGYLEEAFLIRKALGLQHGLTGVIEAYRGDMQLHSQRWPDAAESFSKAVHWYRLTETSPRTIAEALHKCGVALKNQGLYGQAEQKLAESHQISRDLMAEGHNKSRDSKNLGDTVKELEDLKRIRIEESRR